MQLICKKKKNLNIRQVAVGDDLRDREVDFIKTCKKKIKAKIDLGKV